MKNHTQLTKSINSVRNSLGRSLWRWRFLLVIFALTCFALSPQARAVCRDGCSGVDDTMLGTDALLADTGFDNTAIGSLAINYGNSGSFNTAIGAHALSSNTTGDFNTASGFQALFSNTTGNFNTATGAETLYGNTTGIDNTASGYAALYSNTIGNWNTASGFEALYYNTTGNNNTANGWDALSSNTTGNENTASGVNALRNSTTGNNNTATGYQAMQGDEINGSTGSNNTVSGYQALFSYTTGSNNTASGLQALFYNTIGNNNSATGVDALLHNTTGNSNTANGGSALQNNTTGSNNTADGFTALQNNTGSNNIAVGYQAGINLTTGSNNIDIGALGAAGESKAIRIGKPGIQTKTFIAGISGAIVPTGVAVIVDSTGHLGTTTSSARFKEAIKPMGEASEAILDLKPVTFRYKHDLDPAGVPQFGLVAEEVAKINPDLVARDDIGKPFSVRYEAVNAMLLNEFLKEHRKVEEQARKMESLEKAIVDQKKENERMRAILQEQTAQIQKVSAQLAASRPSTRLVVNDQ